jgi:hypothetical protein
VEDEFLQRASHALITESGTWLVDPVDNTRVDGLENVAGVIQLLDRHNRDCAAIAQRLGVPHLERTGGPFEFLPVKDTRRWREVALWWPDRRVLACGDALGTAAYFCAGDERLAVHPLLRLRPPRVDVEPKTTPSGHRTGIYEDAPAALREALSTSRRRIPGQLVAAVRAWRNRPSSP